MAVLLFGAALAGYLGCNQSPQSEGELATPSPPKAGFQEIAAEAGINFKMGFLDTEQGATFKINLYDHGAGLAVGDYNGDGRDDLYFLNQLGPNALYRNHGNGTFEDVTRQMGVALEDRICVGATFADYDNDGDQDLYVTSTRGGNVLFRNEEGKAFRDVTDEAGLAHVGHSQTATFFDYDNDSLLDLYLVQSASWTTDSYDANLKYYVGKGGGGLGAVFKSPKEYNILYRNNGNGTFADVTEESQMRGRGWSGDVAVFDYDEDGWQDVLVTCMFGPAQLYRNLQNGKFADVTLQTLGRTPYGGVGAKILDFNSDGRLDVYIVDMHSDMWMGMDYGHASKPLATRYEKEKFAYILGPHADDSAVYQAREIELADSMQVNYEEILFGNAFYENLGDGRFREISANTNTETFWPWGIAAADFTNDGFEDLFVTSGMGYPFYYWRNSLLINDQRGSFVERSYELGIEPPPGGDLLPEAIEGRPGVRSSRCAATADFDGDGRVELVVNNFNHEPYYFKNQLARRNYVAFRLRGVRSNRDAVGAVVRIPSGEKMLTRQVQSAGGYLSQSSQLLHFGLGDQTHLERVEITWPGGVRQTLENIAANQLHEIAEPVDVESVDVESVDVESATDEPQSSEL